MRDRIISTCREMPGRVSEELEDPGKHFWVSGRVIE